MVNVNDYYYSLKVYAQSRPHTGLLESLGRRRCSACEREVFLLAQSWRHRSASAGGVAAAGTRSALGRLRGGGAPDHARIGAWSPSAAPSAPGSVLSALLRDLALEWPLARSGFAASARTGDPGPLFYSQR